MRTQRCIAPFIGSLALAAAGCVLAWPARASLIAADSFSYTAGGPLAGSGTNASWPTTGRIWTGTGNTYMEIPGVDFTAYYGGLVHSGNVAEIGTGGTSTVMSRLFGTTYNTATASYWFSVMIDIDKDTSDSTSGMYLMNGGTQELFVGDVSGSSKWGMKVGANCEEKLFGSIIHDDHPQSRRIAGF